MSDFIWDDTLKLGRETAALTARVWPRYLVEDSDIPDRTLKFAISPQELERRFPVWGLRHQGQRIAYINAALVHANLEQEHLPNEGWRYAIQAAGSVIQPNALCLLAANIDPQARGHGLAQQLIDRAKQAARDLGFKDVIAPVRPTLKREFPFHSMNDYIQKRSDTGEMYDPWLKVHVKAGGQVTNVCHESVKISASLNKWRDWTKMSLATSGDHIIPEGLAPLKVDIYRGVGIYTEPNVWVRYKL